MKEYDNPIDIKHLKLVSSNWRRCVHPEIRPSPAERDRIEVCSHFFLNFFMDICCFFFNLFLFFIYSFFIFF